MSTRTTTRVGAGTVLLVALIGFLLWFLGPVLLLVFAGVLLAIAFDALSALIVRGTGLPRAAALVAVLVAFALLLIAVALLVVPSFSEQLGKVWTQLSALLDAAEDALEEQAWLQDLLGLGDSGEDVEPMSPSTLAVQAANLTMSAMSAAAALIVLIAIAIFMAVNPTLYLSGLLKLVPLPRRARGGEILSAIGLSLRWWLLGQLVSMTVLGGVTSLGLWVVGVEAWLGLAVLVALFTFVPFLGPIIAGVPVLVISFAEGLETGLIVLAFYLVLQNIEGNLLTPVVQQQAVYMPPALLISVQILMGVIFGFAGLVLAAPLAVVGLVVVNLLYVEDVLGDLPAELRD